MRLTRLLQGQAVRLHGSEMGPPRHERNLGFALQRQPCADKATNGTRAEYANPRHPATHAHSGRRRQRLRQLKA